MVPGKRIALNLRCSVVQSPIGALVFWICTHTLQTECMQHPRSSGLQDIENVWFSRWSGVQVDYWIQKGVSDTHTSGHRSAVRTGRGALSKG